MDLYYNRKGEPVGMWEWANLLENRKYRQVKLTRMGTCSVSTIWFGLLGAERVPMIFETAVFGRHLPEFLDGRLIRYASEQEARAGHKAIRAVVRASRRLGVDGREYQRRRSSR